MRSRNRQPGWRLLRPNNTVWDETLASQCRHPLQKNRIITGPSGKGRLRRPCAKLSTGSKDAARILFSTYLKYLKSDASLFTVVAFLKGVGRRGGGGCCRRRVLFKTAQTSLDGCPCCNVS